MVLKKCCNFAIAFPLNGISRRKDVLWIIEARKDVVQEKREKMFPVKFRYSINNISLEPAL